MRGAVRGYCPLAKNSKCPTFCLNILKDTATKRSNVIDINWSVKNGVLVIKDTNGNDVKLNVGTTWIGYASSNNGGAVK